jgi:iron complex outermembrane receptor protein
MEEDMILKSAAEQTGKASRLYASRKDMVTLSLMMATALSTPQVMAAEPNEDQVGLEEIVVMARRKAESLQNTPVAVTAISAGELEARNITKVNQVAEIAPNVVFEAGAPLTGSTNNGSAYIRGIGTTEFSLGTEPGVGIYVDDVYLARISGNVLDIVDIEAVEVLRGPQGTLFGRNSVGGAIVVRSKRPSEDFETKVRMEVGTDNLIRAGASVDLPVSDNVRTRFSVQRYSQDGYVNDVADREDFGSKDSWSGRGTVELQAAENFRATLHFDYTREKNSAAPYVLVDLFDENPFAPGAPTFVAFANAGLGCAEGSAGNAGGACVDQYFIRGPHETVYGYETDNRFLNDFNKEPFQSLDYTRVIGTSLTLEWELSAFTVKSITAYRDLIARNPRNPDHTPYNVLEANSDLEQNQFTQEIQFTGTGFDERLDWIAGFFYLDESGYQLDSVDLWPLTLHSGGSFDNKNWALFAQSTFDITEDIAITAGVRYTEEDKTFRAVSDDFIAGRTQVIYSFRPFALGIPGATAADDKIEIDPIPLLSDPTPLTFSEFTPHLNVAWNVTDDLMTYASYSRGYKAGGFEQRIATPVAQAGTFDVETVDAYELGFKSTLLDRTLRLNGALFYTDYQDLQCSVVVGIAPTFINCGDGKIKGAEVEANWVPAAGWTVNFAAGYLDAKWKSGTLTPQTATVGIEESDNFAMVPKWSLSGSLAYEFQLGNSGTITPRVDWSYKSKIYKDAANTAVLTQNGYHLVNASLTWLSPDETYSLGIKGENITDKVYMLTGVMQPDGGFAEALYSRGSEWSFVMSVRY